MVRLSRIILVISFLFLNSELLAKNPPPGTGTSDSIPARLSDGEFVFTAKSVKHLGVDKLRKMMAKAENDYDKDMNVQDEQQMESVDDMVPSDVMSAAYGGLMKNPYK